MLFAANIVDESEYKRLQRLVCKCVGAGKEVCGGPEVTRWQKYTHSLPEAAAVCALKPRQERAIFSQ